MFEYLTRYNNTMAALDAVINYSNVGFLFFHKPALSMFIYIKNLKWHISRRGKRGD